jgi:hypothetical protein
MWKRSHSDGTLVSGISEEPGELRMFVEMDCDDLRNETQSPLRYSIATRTRSRLVDQTRTATPVCPRKKSFVYTAKNWALKASASTEFGRNYILNSIGEDGSKLIESVTQISEVLVGRIEASKIKRQLLELVAKSKLLFDENVLQTQDCHRCKVALLVLSKSFHEALLEENKMINVSALELYASELRNQIMAFIYESEAVSLKTIQMIEELSRHFGSKEFIETVLFHKEMKFQREVLKRALFNLLAPILKSKMDLRILQFSVKLQSTFIPENEPDELDLAVRMTSHRKNRSVNSFSRSSRIAEHFPESLRAQMNESDDSVEEHTIVS